MTVGAIVPVHGWAPYLAEALDSVLAESPDEVVVVDDASPEPVALHHDHAQRCTLVRRAERGGPAAARATGLRELDCELVALCDADDAWRPGRLASQLTALGEHPDAVVVFGRAVVVGPDDRPTGERWPEPAPGRHQGPALAASLFERNPIPTSSVLLRRAALHAAGGFEGPVEVAEDWELWLRLARAGGAFLCVAEATVAYRRRPGALTADVAALARAQQRVHELHADLVDAPIRERVADRDRAALAAGLVRAGRHADARELMPPGVRRAALGVPGLRAIAGRRDPYRSD